MIEGEHIQYLTELRRRLLASFFVLASVFAILCFFAKPLYQLLAQPLLQSLPQGGMLIATSITSPFLAPFKLAFFSAIFLTTPFVLYQIWAYVGPALYKNEKRLLWILFFSSVFLFYLGILFAYFIVFPLVFQFFIQIAPIGVEVSPDIEQYLDFALKLFFAFAVAFEAPIVTILLIRSGIVSEKSLREKRPYVIVLAFIIGMLLTPPDVLSQILLAVPLCLLFELGLLLSRIGGEK